MSEFWNGQKYIKLLDPNLLGCKDHMDLLQQLVDSKAKVDFTQGLDARFITKDNLVLLKQVKIEMIHFAFDFMRFEKQIVKGLELVKKELDIDKRKAVVYMLTNFNTTIEEDLYRVEKIRDLGFMPDIRIYRKSMLPKQHVLKDLQRWALMRSVYMSTPFMDYIPRGKKTIRELYFNK